MAELEQAADELSEEHKAAKKALDRAAAELRGLIRQGPTKPDPQRRLFGENDPAPRAGASDPHAWQSISVDNLDIPDGLRALVEAAGIETIGALEAQRASPEGLQGIPRVGQAKADQLEAALLDMLSMTRDARALADGAIKDGTDKPAKKAAVV